MTTPYTILIIGEWNSKNLGDNLLCSTYERLLKSLFPEAKTIRFDISSKSGVSALKQFPGKVLFKLSSYIPFLKPFAQNYHNFILEYSIKRILCRILSKKGNYIAAVAGGALVQDYFAISLNTIGEILEKHNVPIIYNAIGVGNIKKEESKEIFRKLLTRKNIKSISARDNLKELNFTHLPIKHIPDVAICCSQFYHITKPTEKIIGFGILNPSFYINNSKDNAILTENDYKKYIVDVIKKIQKDTNLPIQIFSNGAMDDYLYAQNIKKEIASPYITVAPRPKNEKELVLLINSFSYVIANRLHALILAYSFNIPTYGILWDFKVKYWHDFIQSQEYGHLSSLLKTNIASLINQSQVSREKKEELTKQIILNIKNGITHSLYSI